MSKRKIDPLEAKMKSDVMRAAITHVYPHFIFPDECENPMPFGYNPDGSRNEREAAVVRYIFEKEQEYFFNPPQELIDEANAWAAYEGFTLNDEEAHDLARARIAARIAAEVNEKFPGVKYREAPPPVGWYPTGLKYPSRPFSGENTFDRNLYALVQSSMANEY